MAKIAIKSENITPYGGIYYVMGEFKRTRVGNGALEPDQLNACGNGGIQGINKDLFRN